MCKVFWTCWTTWKRRHITWHTMNPWHIESLSIYIVHIFVLVYSALIELFCFLDVIFGKFVGAFHKMSSTGWWHTSSPWLPSMLHAMAWSVRPLGNCETWPWCWNIRKNNENNIRKASNKIWPLEDLGGLGGRWGDMESNLAQSGQHDNWVLRRAAGGGSFKFSNLDPIHQLSRLGQWTQRFHKKHH